MQVVTLSEFFIAGLWVGFPSFPYELYVVRPICILSFVKQATSIVSSKLMAYIKKIYVCIIGSSPLVKVFSNTSFAMSDSGADNSLKCYKYYDTFSSYFTGKH